MQQIYSVGANERSILYELWLRHKLLKTMEMDKGWSDIYDEGYVHQFQPRPTHKSQ